MRPASAGRLECAGRKILIVTRIVPKNFSNSLVIQKPRNVHGRLDFLDLLVVAVNVRIAVPFARLWVPDPVGNPHGEKILSVEEELYFNLLFFDDVDDPSGDVVHKVHTAILDQDSRLTDSAPQQIFQAVTCGQLPAVDLLRELAG